MLWEALYILGLISLVSAQSISSELSSPTFVPYSRPAQKIEEFIAVGDSYTAGTGCNGMKENMAGSAGRGLRSYPMQMAADQDNWDFINGDLTLPRLSFPAYTGDKTAELVSQQLEQGDYKDNNKDLPRGQPFGKPQIAVATIGGNGAGLSEILNNCVYRAWAPADCQTSLQKLQDQINDGTLRDKINYALYQVAHAGRIAGGAVPRESFQVYVLTYITFFNDVDTQCDNICWGYWWWMSNPKLTTQLRQQLNSLTTQVNAIVKAVAQDLERMGVIFVEGLEEAYNGHRFCEKEYTDQEMLSYNTWFWSPYAPVQTPSEGPNDLSGLYTGGGVDPGQSLLDFVFPGENYTMLQLPRTPPPWEWKSAEKYTTFNDLLIAISNAADDGADINAIPYNLLRSFHPKGTAYGEHKTLLFGAIANNRDLWYMEDNVYLVSTCTDKDGNEKVTVEDLSLCVHYNNGALIPREYGSFRQECTNCFFNPDTSPDHSTLWCVCKNDEDPYDKDASINLDDFITVQDDGYMRCFGHISVPQ
ncbi:SGNH hydrolase [Nemania sp. FL0031]|nr:SGNH hydrolase [Nemania sp. FL0031]